MGFSKAKKIEKEIILSDRRLMSPSYYRETDFVFACGSGANVFDYSQKKYLDFAAGVAVMSAGHCNPEIVKAIRKQLWLGTHAAFPDFYAEPPVRFSKTLLSLLSPSLNRVFLSNSGTESIECAIKLSRWNTRKKWLVAFTPCFHGRTMGSLSMTDSSAVQRKGFGPFLQVKHAPYPYTYRFKNQDESECSNASLFAVEKIFRKLDGNVSAVFFEPISGEGGYIVPPKNFAADLKKLCKEFGVLLCDDEVQSGCFRTGKFLAISNFGVVPDIVSMGKAIGGGLPLGATIAGKKLMRWPRGAHSNTFGGNLLACAAGHAAISFMEKKNAAANARKVGSLMLKRLNEMKEEIGLVGDVRGIGLMIGVELVASKKSRKPAPKKQVRAVKACYKNGLVILAAGKSVLRICPPLFITGEHAMHGLDILEKSLKEVS